MSLRVGIVVANDDPDNLRRVKVQSQDRGSSVSDWLSRLTSFDSEDLPVPSIGSSVIIGSIDGNTHSDIVIGVLQSEGTNQPLDKDQPGDYVSDTPGHWISIAERLELLNALAKIEVMEDSGIKLSNQLGSIYLLPSGYTIVSYPGGSISIGSNGFEINSDTPININSPDLIWNGSRVARVGGRDSRNDTTLS